MVSWGGAPSQAIGDEKLGLAHLGSELLYEVDQLLSLVYVQLHVYALGMHAHRVLGHHQHLGDARHRVAAGHQLHDLGLARGQAEVLLYARRLQRYAVDGLSRRCAGLVFVDVRTVSWKGESPMWMPVAAAALMLAAIFVMRFQFYMIHMTVGVGV